MFKMTKSNLKFLCIIVQFILLNLAQASDEIILTPKYPVYCKDAKNEKVRVVSIVDSQISTTNGIVEIEILWNKGSCAQILRNEGKTSIISHVDVYGRTSGGIVRIEGLNSNTRKIANGKYAVTKITFDQALLETTNQFEIYLFEGIMLSLARMHLKVISDTNGKLKLSLTE